MIELKYERVEIENMLECCHIKENDVYVGLPAILNKDGAERRVYLKLTEEESEKLLKCMALCNDAKKQKGVATISSGNHGSSVSYAASFGCLNLNEWEQAGGIGIQFSTDLTKDKGFKVIDRLDKIIDMFNKALD